MFFNEHFYTWQRPEAVAPFRAETEGDESQRHVTHRVQVINSSSEDLLVHTAWKKA